MHACVDVFACISKREKKLKGLNEKQIEITYGAVGKKMEEQDIRGKVGRCVEVYTFTFSSIFILIMFMSTEKLKEQNNE